MRVFLNFLLISFALVAFAQQDTIVVTDFTKVLVETKQNGDLSPVTSLDQVNQAGFFITGRNEGHIRICNPEPLAIWINGRLFEIIENCEFIRLSEWLKNDSNDTLYVSLSSKNELVDLKCELVIFEDLKIVKEDSADPREARNVLREFVILGWILLTIVLGIFLVGFPTRVSYLKGKAFTFKISAYEFVNTSFFSGPSLNLVAFYSLALSFVLFYFNFALELNLFEKPISLLFFLWEWIKLSAMVFGLILIKWVIISVIAGLFNFKGLKNYQLFDFINFQTLLLIPILIFLFLDFLFGETIGEWVSPSLMIVFPLVLILFIIWFTLKFVNNSPRKKLMIISYLCATEIIPAIIMIGLFYK
ncbi:DUF4271 domain-containing protein [Ekhidna sp.]|uniref:DUF4271 domain-containing protein n=1 Tax=Ekhidna sp. TaxID=2608089 RepID=UPI003CCB7995